ncbi:telomere-protecting terminal protein Tpg [Streptomyces goshikiensis]|uniref:telomere-protecting terminal protein Tpg n=1 Tax=Streptomyces goshikiensis TaxID=1942 RepID=UPI00369261DC
MNPSSGQKLLAHAAIGRVCQPSAAATSTGLIVQTRARFGYTAASGTTDDGRLRHLTELPASYVARLFEAQGQGSTEEELLAIAAEGFQEIYFKDRGRRAGGLLVEFTGVQESEVTL